MWFNQVMRETVVLGRETVPCEVGVRRGVGHLGTCGEAVIFQCKDGEVGEGQNLWSLWWYLCHEQ